MAIRSKRIGQDGKERSDGSAGKREQEVLGGWLSSGFLGYCGSAYTSTSNMYVTHLWFKAYD
jgi:hypothetical protein